MEWKAAALVLATAATAAAWDARTGRIPRALTWGAALASLCLLGDGQRWLSGLLVGAALPLLAESFVGEVGGGDVALLAALGSMLGPLYAACLCALAWSCLTAQDAVRPRISRPAGPAVLLAAALLLAVVLGCAGRL